MTALNTPNRPLKNPTSVTFPEFLERKILGESTTWINGLLAALIAALSLLTALPAYATNETVRVPVLANNVGANEVIKEGDLIWQSVPAYQVRADVVTQPEDIIGLAPRRAQRAGKVLRRVEYAPPIAVRKGSYVTMMLRHGALLLTTQGRALEQGAVGETIRLVNIDSNNTIPGEIVAPGIVAVTIYGQSALLALN